MQSAVGHSGDSDQTGVGGEGWLQRRDQRGFSEKVKPEQRIEYAKTKDMYTEEEFSWLE